jgi:hypothetical protein
MAIVNSLKDVTLMQFATDLIMHDNTYKESEDCRQIYRAVLNKISRKHIPVTKKFVSEIEQVIENYRKQEMIANSIISGLKDIRDVRAFLETALDGVEGCFCGDYTKYFSNELGMTIIDSSHLKVALQAIRNRSNNTQYCVKAILLVK